MMAHDGATIARRRATQFLYQAQQFPVSHTRQEITVVECRLHSYTHTLSLSFLPFVWCLLLISLHLLRVDKHTGTHLNRRQWIAAKSSGWVDDLDTHVPSSAHYLQPLVKIHDILFFTKYNSHLAEFLLFSFGYIIFINTCTVCTPNWPSGSLTTFQVKNICLFCLPRVHESATLSTLLLSKIGLHRQQVRYWNEWHNYIRCHFLEIHSNSLKPGVHYF